MKNINFKTVRAAAHRYYFNFLVDQELIPIFLEQVRQKKEFITFARFTAKVEPSVLFDTLKELKILPNNNLLQRQFKSWRDDIENLEELRRARKRVCDRLNSTISKNIQSREKR